MAKQLDIDKFIESLEKHVYDNRDKVREILTIALAEQGIAFPLDDNEAAKIPTHQSIPNFLDITKRFSHLKHGDFLMDNHDHAFIVKEITPGEMHYYACYNLKLDILTLDESFIINDDFNVVPLSDKDKEVLEEVLGDNCLEWDGNQLTEIKPMFKSGDVIRNSDNEYFLITGLNSTGYYLYTKRLKDKNYIKMYTQKQYVLVNPHTEVGNIITALAQYMNDNIKTLFATYDRELFNKKLNALMRLNTYIEEVPKFEH